MMTGPGQSTTVGAPEAGASSATDASTTPFTQAPFMEQEPEQLPPFAKLAVGVVVFIGFLTFVAFMGLMVVQLFFAKTNILELINGMLTRAVSLSSLPILPG